ncbi:MAG: DNA recombination protein RmuC [Sphingomonadaceae bacterium]
MTVLALVLPVLALLAGWLLWGRHLAAVRQAATDQSGQLGRAMSELAQYRERHAEARAVAGEATLRANDLAVNLAALEATHAERERAHATQLAQLRGEFQRVAAEALAGAQKQFTEQAAETLKLHRAETEKGLEAGKQALGDLIRPMRETLGRYESELKQIETKREHAYGGLAEQLTAVAQGQLAVKAEAGKIVAALRSSAKASGAWGEAQLRNVLEMAGLRQDIDFRLQSSSEDSDGNRRRPDAIISMPGGRELIVDSKCSLGDYLTASEAENEADRNAALRRHAQAVRVHARGLAEKAYWNQFAKSADFVIMFLPGENFLAAALENDLELLQWALDQRILLAGPTNLLAIARVIAMVWRQEKMAEEAQRIGTLGAELYASLATMTEHLNRVGRNIGEAAGAYNAFVGSLESRVLSKARRFPELGVDPGKKPLPELLQVDRGLRLPQAPELTADERAVAATG